MAVNSDMSLPVGSSAPEFSLPDVVAGGTVTNDDFSSASGLLVIFLCRHCPYVVHVRDELIRLASDFSAKGLRCVGICSNDAEKYPDDAPEKLREMALQEQIPFPILYDEDQSVARAYSAACTPDFFLFDGKQKLFYRGRLDDSTPGNGKPVTGADLRGAIQSLLAGDSSPEDQQPSKGCSIKWK